MNLTRILLPGFVIHSFKYRKVAAWSFSSFDGKRGFLSLFFFCFPTFLVLCEHPVSSEPLPAELRAAARPLETQLRLQGIARALTGHPLSSGFVVFFFFFPL